MALNKELILDVVYPVGSIYMSVNSTSPQTLFGGTWEQLQGKFLLGATDGTNQQELLNLGYRWSSNNYSYWLDSNGTRHSITPNTANYSAVSGEVSHTLTVDEMPSHKHDTLFLIGNGSNGAFQAVSSTGSAINHQDTMNTGGGQAHNNMPPYLVVYMWKRTS